MELKPGAKIGGLSPEISFALTVADGLYREVGKECVVTSCTDGTHTPHSRHYIGHAVDLRTRHLDDPDHIAQELSRRLGSDFMVLVEHTHIHVAFKP